LLKSALIAFLSACLVLAGCTTTRHVPFNQQTDEAPALKPGDTVRVTLKSGQVRRLKVAVAGHETLTGQDLDAAGNTSIQIALADVQTLEVRKVSSGKTVGLGLAIIAGIVAVLYALFFISCYSEYGQCTA
jgi:hypothetical protein